MVATDPLDHSPATDAAHPSRQSVRALYYGQFYKSKLASVLGQFDYALRRWARKKLKRLKAGPTRAGAWLRPVAQQKPDLFATGLSPSPEWLNDRSGMDREIRVPLRESPEVKSL